MTVEDTHLDVYSEITNIGTGNAATALAGFLHARVELDPPVAYVTDLYEACDLLLGESEETSVVLLEASGDLDGVIALFLADPGPYLEALGAPREYEQDVIAEIGNIFAARFLDAIGAMLSLEGHHAPPATACGDRNAIMETVLGLAAAAGSFTLVRCWLRMEDGQSPAELVYFPGPAALEHVSALL
jgi:chemotaxis protein CheC